MTRIAQGASASLAVINDLGSWEVEDAPLIAKIDRDGLILQGSARFVQDAFKSDLFVVSAKLGDEIVLCLIEANPKASLWNKITFTI
jgi:hypothetical protein